MENKLANKNGKSNTKKVFQVLMNDRHLKEVPNLENPKHLKVAYFHNNAIEKLENLNLYTNLTHLYLQWNKINQMKHFDHLKNLKKLFLGYNRISVVENLENLKCVEELHVEKQKLENGESLCFEPKTLESLGKSLQVLNISGNSIERGDVLEKMQHLKTLSAKDNLIDDFENFARSLSKLFNLREIDCRGNPMSSKHRYKETLIAHCYKLESIDGKVVTDLNRRFIKCFEEKRNMLFIPAKEKSVDKVRSNISPDSLLTMLEAKRDAKEKARQMRLQQMASCSVIPRCFWRNRSSLRCKDAQVDNFTNL